MVIDPTLALAITALVDGGHWVTAFDNQWRIVAIPHEATRGREVLDGSFHFGPEAFDHHQKNTVTGNTPEENRDALRHLGGWILSDLAIDRDALRERVHPALRDIVDELESNDSIAVSWDDRASYFSGALGLTSVAQRVRDATGHVVGTVLLVKPAVAMGTIAMLCAAGDPEHLERMHRFAEPSRRPAAVLFADLEGSTQLSKQLPTATYFRLVRRITRAADQCVVDRGGLVGRHVGDGVAAFFAAETAGSEAAAAGACITAARAIQAAMSQVAEGHDWTART
jgi:hypothetical protein